MLEKERSVREKRSLEAAQEHRGRHTTRREGEGDAHVGGDTSVRMRVCVCVSGCMRVCVKEEERPVQKNESVHQLWV